MYLLHGAPFTVKIWGVYVRTCCMGPHLLLKFGGSMYVPVAWGPVRGLPGEGSGRGSLRHCTWSPAEPHSEWLVQHPGEGGGGGVAE